jgi:hypothetical protein
MPKKPRKTRIGSRAWAAQKAHDIAQNQTAKEQEKEKEKAKEKAHGNRKRAHHNEQWQKERKEKQEQKQDQEHRQSWRQQTGTHHDPKRLACLRVLGLTPDKDNEESIKREYRRLSLLFHPDRNPIVSALEKMKAINNAFEYLMGKNM